MVDAQNRIALPSQILLGNKKNALRKLLYDIESNLSETLPPTNASIKLYLLDFLKKSAII